MQASESALGKTEFENAAQHLNKQGSVAFGQSTGVMLPYNLQRLCLRLRQNKREVSKPQDNYGLLQNQADHSSVKQTRALH